MRFHEHILASFIPDFIEVQQSSFKTLLKKGISKEVSKINPIRDSTNRLEFFFYPQYYILTQPTYTPTEAILKLKSYTSKLYVPVQITLRTKGLTTLHWFLLCDLPLMTKRGSFIVNGSPRVVVNQLIRSPGIYYNCRVIRTMTTTVNRFYADIIPWRGTWLRLEYNKVLSSVDRPDKERVWARMKRVAKISGFLFLSCFKPRNLIYKTTKAGYSALSDLGLLKAYPFFTDLKRIFFEYNFVRLGLKEKKWLDSLEEEFAYTDPKLVLFGKKKKRKRRGLDKKDVANWKLDTEFLIKIIGREEDKWIEQVLLETNYPFAFLFIESGENVDNLARTLQTPQYNKLKRMIRNQAFAEYTAEQLVTLGILFLHHKFFNKKNYTLGFLGRLRLNKRFGIEERKMTLTQSDVFYALHYLFSFQGNFALKDDIDNLKNKRVKASGELIENQLTTGLLVLKELLCKKIDIIINPDRADAKTTDNEEDDLSMEPSFDSIFGVETEIPLDTFLLGKRKSKTDKNQLNLIKKKNQDHLKKGNQIKGHDLILIEPKHRVKPLKRLLKSIELLPTTKPINGTLRVFFGTSPLSQYLDQTNPLADITHKRRVSCLGPGGLNRETAGMPVRNIHPTHYGRVCPIETPEGRNAGLVNSVAIYGRLNRDGYLQTPFYNLYKGQIQKRDTSFYDQRPTFFSVEQSQYIREATPDTRSGKLSFLKTRRISIKVGTSYSSEVPERADYRALDPIQMISIATSLIPFLEHNDATRALMGSNMQRQSLPIIFPERAIVGTGLEGRVAAESGHLVQSRLGGYVSYASGQRVVIFGNSTLPKDKKDRREISGANWERKQAGFLSGLEKNLPSSLRREKLRGLKSKATFYPFSVNLRLLQRKQRERGLVNNFKSSYLIIIGNQNEQLKPTKKVGVGTSHNLSRENHTNHTAFKEILTRNTLNDLDSSKRNPQIFWVSLLKDVQASKAGKFNQSQDLHPNDQRFSNTKNTKNTKNTNSSLKDLLNPGFFIYPIKRDTRMGPKKKHNFEKSQGVSLVSFVSFELHDIFQGYRYKNSWNDFQKMKGFRSLSTNLFQPTIWYFQPFTLEEKEKRSLREKSLNPKKKEEKEFLQFRKNDLKRKDHKDRNQPFLHFIDLDPNYQDLVSLFLFFFNQSKSRPTSLYLQRQETKHIIKSLGVNGDQTDLNQTSLLFSQTIPFTDLKSLTCSRFTLLKHDMIHSLRCFFVDQTSFLPFFSFVPFVPLSGFGDDPIKATHHSGFNSKGAKGPTLLHLLVPSIKNDQEQGNHHPHNDQNLHTNHTLGGLQKRFRPFNYINSIKGKNEHSLESYQRSNQSTCLSQRPSVSEGEWVQRGDLLADCTSSVLGDVSVGKNILVAYMPWQGYNFEDAVLISDRLVVDDIYTSIHLERFSISIRQTDFGLERISRDIPWTLAQSKRHLNKDGFGKIGYWLKEKEILIGKVTPIKDQYLSPHQKLFYDIIGKRPPTTRDTSLRVPKRQEGKITHLEILKTTQSDIDDEEVASRANIFFAERLRIQIGDKISGRHGNKGIISNIIPRQDMPYLPNGTPVDMVLNPLGVPSRMNVGQVFETLLGLAGIYLNESFKIKGFTSSYGDEVSRSLVYSKLYQARLKSGEDWLFNPEFPGKTRVFDGRTGFCFDQSVTVGQSYMLKLIHLVDHKIHARSTGPYSRITQQPLKGRAKHGGQRVGEMEVWALQGFGAAYTLQEILTIKSDDISNRDLLFVGIFSSSLVYPNITLQNPEIFKVLIAELQSLSLGFEFYDKFTPINVMDFIKSGKINRNPVKKKDHTIHIVEQPSGMKVLSDRKKRLLSKNKKQAVLKALKLTLLKMKKKTLNKFDFVEPLTFNPFKTFKEKGKQAGLLNLYFFLTLLPKQEKNTVSVSKKLKG